VVSIIGISRDITEQKAAEKALRSAHLELESRNQDLKNAYNELYEYSEAVSQDLNGIIRAVSNYTDFLYEDLSQSLTGEQRLYLENLKQVAREGSLLIKELKTLAKIGKYPEEPAPIDFDGIVNETAACLKLTPERVGLDLPDTWPAVKAPPGLVRVTLNNLFSNAVKFNQSEKPHIEMGWREHTPGRIEIYVRDNGIGIDPLYHARVFQVFKRLHTRKEYEGTGIGLAMVSKAVSHMGGSVRVESTPGQGSTFFVDLPLSTT
jgi:light-regulated signal transduction histidine kinase (bacteriophytochrome)